MYQPYPKVDSQLNDPAATTEMAWIQALVTNVRTIRSTMHIPPAKPIPLLLQKGTTQERAYINDNQHLLTTLTKISTIDWLDDNATPPPAATSIVGTLKLFIPLEGLIDKTAERDRLAKTIEKLQKDQRSCQQQLNNPAYLANAPKAIVKTTQQRLATIELELEKYLAQLAAL